MPNAVTQMFLETYREEGVAPTFLSSLARSRTFTSEKVTVDIVREDTQIASPVKTLQDFGKENDAQIYTNKEYLPPIYKEVAAVQAYSAIERAVGQDPFSDPNYAANIASSVATVMGAMDRKIRRSVELQASQVLQTGATSLSDGTGVVYSNDYKVKASHFPTTSNDWGAGGDDPLADLSALAYQIHEDGRGNPNRLIMGRSALNAFLRDTKVQGFLDNRRISIGQVNRPQNIGGGVFHGDITIGSFVCEIWGYDGFYTPPGAGSISRYIEDDKVIMLCDNTRMDLVYGAIPHIAPADSRVLPFLPSRVSENGGDMTLNAWFAPDGATLNVSAGTRALYIPVAVDTYGCLDTVA